MITVEGSAVRRAILLVLPAAAVIAAVVACRSGAQVPKDVQLPVILPTVSRDVCMNDRQPLDAPQFGDNSAIPYVPQPSGLKVFDRVTGSGGSPSSGDIVTVNYTGWLEDGCIFDSSYVRGEPTLFPLDQLIFGWGEGIRSMRAGGKRRIEIPPHLAYGTVGFPGVIPPNATLVFEIELVSFAEPTPSPEPEAEPSPTPTP